MIINTETENFNCNFLGSFSKNVEIIEAWLLDNFKEYTENKLEIVDQNVLDSKSTPRHKIYAQYLKFCQNSRLQPVSRSFLGKVI